MKKNTAGQFVGAEMIDATTGAAFTGAVTCYVTGDNGTQAVGSVGAGACTHKGNGLHNYAPAQAETNYDYIEYTFIGTGAIAVTHHVRTTFPQTGDNFVRLGAPAGASLAADVAAVNAKTTNLPPDPADASDIATSLGTLATAAILAQVKAKTDNLPPDPADASDIAAAFAAVPAAVLAAAIVAPIAASIEQVNGVTVAGNGLTGNKWRPA